MTGGAHNGKAPRHESMVFRHLPSSGASAPCQHAPDEKKVAENCQRNPNGLYPRVIEEVKLKPRISPDFLLTKKDQN